MSRIISGRQVARWTCSELALPGRDLLFPLSSSFLCFLLLLSSLFILLLT